MSTTPMKSASLKKLIDNLTVQTYTDAEDALEEAKKHGMGSRAAIYLAFAYAYQWYHMSLNQEAYMRQKFKSNDIKVSDEDTNFFIPTIKMVFGFNEGRYASRISEYALVLQYVHENINDAEYVNDSYLPTWVTELINENGGVRKCSIEQRKANNGTSNNLPCVSDEMKFLREKLKKHYASKKAKNSVKVTDLSTSSEFVLMIGRPDKDGEVDIVEVMPVGANEIFNLTQDCAFNDCSGLPDVFNMLADALGYLHTFGLKDEPCISIEKGGEAIVISLPEKELASVVITARPKDPDMFGSLTDRVRMAPKNANYFLERAQSRMKRHLYKLEENTDVDSAELAFNLTSNVDAEKTQIIHFYTPTNKTVKQLTADKIADEDWKFKVGFGLGQLDELYLWTKGWATLPRSSAADRIIPITVDHENVTFEGDVGGGSELHVVPVESDLPEGTSYTYRIFGRELVKVIEQLHLNPDVMGFYMRAPKKFLLELTAEDKLMDYTIDMPTAAKGDKNHNESYFSALQ